VGVPLASLSPSSLTFGNVNLGTTSAVQMIRVSNPGTSALSITGIAVSADYRASSSCGRSLAAGASCTVSVTFHPSAIGKRTGSIRISDDATGSPQSIDLTGFGLEVKLSATSLIFPITTVGRTSSAQKVTLTNIGSTALNISYIYVGGTDRSNFSETNTCGSSVAAGTSCTFSVTFHPSATATRVAGIWINDNGGTSAQVIRLSGTGQ
jgi:hypothetical protein